MNSSQERQCLILIDNNISKHIAYALNTFNRGEKNNIEIKPVNDHFYDGVSDNEMLSRLGKNALIITSDKFRGKEERELLKKNNISWVYISNKKGKLKMIDIFRIIINKWEIITDTKSYPIYYQYSERKKFQKMNF